MWTNDELKDMKNVMLKDIASFSKGKNVSKDDVEENGEYYCIRYGELYTRYNEKITTIYSKTNEGDGLVRSIYGDVLIPSSGETAIDLATASTVLQDDIIIGGDINILRPNISIVNSLYLSYLLNSSQKYNIAKIAQGSSVIHVYNDQLKKLTFNIHNIGTQEKIAHLLSSIDDLIEENEILIQYLNNRLDWYMHKIYSNAPIHLSLDAILQVTSNSNYMVKDASEHGDFSFYTSSNCIRSDFYINEGEHLLLSKDVAFNTFYGTGKFAYTSGLYEVLTEYDKSYIHYLFKYNSKKITSIFYAGSSIKHAVIGDLIKYKVNVHDQENSYKYGKLLKQLEEEIQLLNEVIKNLKLVKQYQLNNIFK